MKQGAVINKIVMLLFFLAILLYFGGAAWRGLRQPYATVQAYAYALDDIAEATGYLAREEQVLTGSEGIVRLVPAEGEKVAAGATVARLYADESAVERAKRIEALEAEEAQLTAAIAAAGEQGSHGERSSQTVVDALVKLRVSTQTGDLTQLEDQAASFKNTVYSQIQRGGDQEALNAALSNTRTEIASLRAQSVESVGRVTAAQSGIFSGQVDGYETVLLPKNLQDLTPADLDDMEDRARSSDLSALGKLITNSTWYFVCPLSQEVCARLTVDKPVTVRFSRDWSGTVKMNVESIGKLYDGRAAVVLSSDRYLSSTTLLRRQTVELVFATQNGIRVPTAALRMEEGQPVVYVKVGVFAEKKAVTVLAQGEDYYLVSPLLPEDATDTQRKKALRAGDAVIITAEEIWDKKVLE